MNKGRGMSKKSIEMMATDVCKTSGEKGCVFSFVLSIGGHVCLCLLPLT